MNDRFFPEGAVKVTPKCLDCVLGLYEKDVQGKQYFGFIGYTGKSAKHNAFYRYRSIQQRDEAIGTYLKQVKSIADYREQRKTNKVLQSNPVKPSDVFYTSWGYDQTNVEFYQVTEVKGLFVWIRQIRGSHVEGSEGFMCANVVAVPDSFVENAETIKKRVLTYDGGKSVYLKISDSANAWVWDGRPKYSSWYA